MKLYAVTAIDIGDTVNGHASLQKVFTTREVAKKWIELDKKNMIDTYGVSFEVNEDGELFVDSSYQLGCIWDIHEIDTDKVCEKVKD